MEIANCTTTLVENKRNRTGGDGHGAGKRADRATVEVKMKVNSISARLMYVDAEEAAHRHVEVEIQRYTA